MATHPSLVKTALPASVRVVATAGGLPRVEVSTAAATAQVYFQGAQITQWTPAGAGESLLFLSAHSRFHTGKAIRGGVPICFPWFGDHSTDPHAPAHGFVRVADWTLIDASETADGTVTLAFVTQDDRGAHALWPHPFRITHRISIGRVLSMTLEVENPGHDSFSFEEALHSYFTVSDIEQCGITGLAHTDYLDKVEGFARRRQGVEAIRFAGETDRVYLDTITACRLIDPRAGRDLVIGKSHSRSTVVWNPWIERARALADFGDAEWRQMVCVETANVRDAAVRLEPGERHAMTAEIRYTPSSLDAREEAAWSPSSET
jgi:glucose-6-phosphate 1-epimerase